MLLAAGAIAPALGAKPRLNLRIRRIATKAVKQQIGPLGNPIFIQETELDRFGLVKLNMGAPAAAIGTYGPFTVQATCTDADPTADTDIRAAIEIKTSENNAILDTAQTTDLDFDVADGFLAWEVLAPADPDNDPGDPATSAVEDAEGFAAAPSGLGLDGRVALFTNLAGAHCAFHGWFLRTAPQA